MRLRHLVIATCCVVVQLAAPAPAQAWWGMDRSVERPGAAYRLGFPVAMVCIPETRPGAINISLDGITTKKRRLARAFGAGCLFDKDINPMGSLNSRVRPGLLRRERTRLRARGEKASCDDDQEFEPSLSMFADASKRIEVTSGLGVLVIHGEGIDTFAHYYWSPLRVYHQRRQRAWA